VHLERLTGILSDPPQGSSLVHCLLRTTPLPGATCGNDSVTSHGRSLMVAEAVLLRVMESNTLPTVRAAASAGGVE
jgi:hypothetical protein